MLLLHFYDIWRTFDEGGETPDFTNPGAQDASKGFSKSFRARLKGLMFVFRL